MAGLGMLYEVVDEKLSAGRGEEFSAAAIVRLSLNVLSRDAHPMQSLALCDLQELAVTHC